MAPLVAVPERVPARRAGAAAVLVALVLGAMALSPAPAAAHGPDGLFQVQRSTVVAPLTVEFRVRLIYANDTDPVTRGATVTVQGTGPGGSVGPTTMAYTGTDGYYTATVGFPAGGTWAISFRSANPAAQYAHTEVVPAPAPLPTPPPAAPAAPPAPTTAPPTTTPPPTSAAPPAPDPSGPVPASAVPPEATPTSTASAGADPTPTELAVAPASTTRSAGYDLSLVVVGVVVALGALGLVSAVAWRGGSR